MGHKKRAHARRVKAWRREKKIKARARERTRKSKIRAIRWAAVRRAKELLKKRSRPRGKIGCKQAQERIAKNAVSYLGALGATLSGPARRALVAGTGIPAPGSRDKHTRSTQAPARITMVAPSTVASPGGGLFMPPLLGAKLSATLWGPTVPVSACPPRFTAILMPCLITGRTPGTLWAGSARTAGRSSAGSVKAVRRVVSGGLSRPAGM